MNRNELMKELDRIIDVGIVNAHHDREVLQEIREQLNNPVYIVTEGCYSDYHSMISAAATCTEEDLVVGISNMGRTASVVESLGIAGKNGAGTVAITSVKGSVVDQSADITLLTGYDYSSFAKDQQIVCYEADAENLPQYAIVDSLYLMCVAAVDETAIDRYRLTADLINAKRL